MPRFSICIPTRERHETLPYAIQTVLAQTYRDFELIIQDNCSGEETAAVVARFDDPRVVYQRSSERLPMHANWEAALDRTSGEYLIFLGDDDGLQPDCLQTVVQLIEGRDVELLAWLANTYFWPNVPDSRRRNHFSIDLRASAFWAEYYAPVMKPESSKARGRPLPAGILCLDSEGLLRNWLDHSGPRLYIPTYHNLVSRRIVERVRSKASGVYFFDPLPDFGTLIANLYVSDEVWFYAAPLSTTGHAGGSAGGTHGDLESWSRHLERFIAEAKLEPQDLLPSVFEPFLWNPTILAGCYENVKRRLFPDDARFEMGWENFIRSAAAQVNGEPKAVRKACRDWIFRSAKRIGMDPDSIDYPPVPDFARPVGSLVDVHGRIQYQYVDGDFFRLRTIADAVTLASQFRPLAVYSTPIPAISAPQPARAVAPWPRRIRSAASRWLAGSRLSQVFD
jgi:glycosyltransferase involved in cell wall biosynthesis